MKLQFMSSQKFNALTAAARRPAGPVMVESLRKLGVTVTDELAANVATDLTRLNALHQLDFAGKHTAFEHIQRLAQAGTLVDGTKAATLAGDLFALAGSARPSDFNVAKCYARASQTVFSLHHAGEFTRLLGELAATGQTRLANGETVRWNPSTMPIRNTHILDLWGGINHIAVERNSPLPRGGELSVAKADATRGQMANITTRLFGTQFVNANGTEAKRHLNGFIDTYGPMLAEYGIHGGTVAEVHFPAAGLPETIALEENGTFKSRNNLGYVVVPAEDAATAGLATLEYRPDDRFGYYRLGTTSPEAQAGAAPSTKAAGGTSLPEFQANLNAFFGRL